MHNVEFKSELRDPEAARQQCRLLGARRAGTLHQTDTYYRLADGRLKRREVPGVPVEWIYYHRRDLVRPRRSDYAILTDTQARRRWGTRSLKSWVTVVKKRELWLLGNVRIHIDEVDKLGTFIEFEAAVSGEHDMKSCHRRVQELRETFAPALGEAVGCGYSDLLARHLADERDAAKS